MTDAKLTAAELNELELPAHMAKASGFKQVTIDVDHALALIAAARELESLTSALEFSLRRCHVTNSKEQLLRCGSADEVVAFARMLGWKGTTN